MTEKEVIDFIEKHPGCTPIEFAYTRQKLVDNMVKQGKLIRRVGKGWVAHYYTPAQIERLDELEMGYETQ